MSPPWASAGRPGDSTEPIRWPLEREIPSAWMPVMGLAV